MVPEKSSIGLISSKISSSPDCSGTSLRPAARASSTRAFHLSLPSSQSNDSVCRASRSGTLSGSWMRAKETRRGPEAVATALRDAANRDPSELVADLSPHARQTPCGRAAHGRGYRFLWPRTSECSANGQCSPWPHCSSTLRPPMDHVERSIARSRQNVKPEPGTSGNFYGVMDATSRRTCDGIYIGYYTRLPC